MLTLDELCEHLEIKVHPFTIRSIGEGERLILGPRDAATVHYVVAGCGTLSFPDFSELSLCQGTVIIAPRGSLQEIAGISLSGTISNVVRRCQALAMDWGAPHEVDSGIAVLRCTVDVTYRHLNDFFDYMPEPIIIQARPDDVISQGFEEIVREMAAPQPGTKAMLSALFQQCFIKLLRKQMATGESALDWLAALQDPRLSKVIVDIIENPGHPYSLELLADKCMMSRTTFAERFRKTFGRSAMDFVREVRLRRAARLLRQTEDPVKTIAARMGYASRSNFSHAFSTFFGITPVEYRSVRVKARFTTAFRENPQRLEPSSGFV